MGFQLWEVGVKLGENHQKLSFIMIFMKFDIRNPFFEPHHISNNYVIGFSKIFI